MLKHILTFDGAYAPRFIRCSNKTLSNHAFGTAFDINADKNPLGAQPALAGRKGCVFELVPTAHQFGFYWEDIFHAATVCISKLPNVSPRPKSTRFLSVSKLRGPDSADVGAEVQNRVLSTTVRDR